MFSRTHDRTSWNYFTHLSLTRAHRRVHTHTHTLFLSLRSLKIAKQSINTEARENCFLKSFLLQVLQVFVCECVFGGANQSGRIEEDDRLRSRAKRASRMQQRHWGIGHQSQPQKRQSRASHRNYLWAHRHALRRRHLPNRHLFARSLFSPFLSFLQLKLSLYLVLVFFHQG